MNHFSSRALRAFLPVALTLLAGLWLAPAHAGSPEPEVQTPASPNAVPDPNTAKET